MIFCEWYKNRLTHKDSTAIFLQIRINALTCIDHLLDSLDKMLILDNILPFLANISGQDPDVVMCVVGKIFGYVGPKLIFR